MSDYKVTVTSLPFGTNRDGKKVDRWILSNGSMEVSILTHGATVQKICVPGRDGQIRDVVLGYDTLEEYEQNTCYFGSAVGRVANRIGGGQFTLNDETYTLVQNNGPNCLHGGTIGFDRKVWDAEIAYHGVKMTYTSPDGEEGFPGELKVSITYSLEEDNSLSIHYEAISDKDTLCNMTNHSYFNLNGHGEGDVLGQELLIEADYYTPLNETFVPDGQIVNVKDTPFDFCTYRTIGSRIKDDHPQVIQAGGYDHNFVVRGMTGTERRAAIAICLESGIRMETLTTKPGVQLYTPDYPTGDMTGKDGKAYEGSCAFCLETQYFPNAMAYGHFEKPVLKAGATYDHTTVYRFSIV
ncbi:MAG: galactose mutarotase [Firmicutes bacterium]|nr:galactose mutarotase [Bacillota bacterium]